MLHNCMTYLRGHRLSRARQRVKRLRFSAMPSRRAADVYSVCRKMHFLFYIFLRLRLFELHLARKPRRLTRYEGEGACEPTRKHFIEWDVFFFFLKSKFSNIHNFRDLDANRTYIIPFLSRWKRALSTLRICIYTRFF